MATTPGKKGRKIGRNKHKCELYKQRKLREKHKLKRILRSNGYDFAVVWSLERGLPKPPQPPVRRQPVEESPHEI